MDKNGVESLIEHDNLVGNMEDRRFLPGDDVPVKGAVPFTSNKDLYNHLDLYGEAHVNIFNLRDDADREEYEKILQKKSNGNVSCNTDIQWSEKEQTFLALVHWTEYTQEYSKFVKDKKLAI